MRILLAEDDKSLSTALVAILKHNGYAADAVWTFVSFLRKKLSAVSGRVTVRSVRGAGYRTEVSDVKETEN